MEDILSFRKERSHLIGLFEMPKETNRRLTTISWSNASKTALTPKGARSITRALPMTQIHLKIYNAGGAKWKGLSQHQTDLPWTKGYLTGKATF